jgi:hypothetical protein
LADLVGLTDNERILNAAVIDIGNLLMITTEPTDEIQAIIRAIHDIFTQQLKIEIPDNISIQITISVICKHKLTELGCYTVSDHDTPNPEIVSRSWEDFKALVDARTAKGITSKIVKTELIPLLPRTDQLGNGRYATPTLGITKHDLRLLRNASIIKSAPSVHSYQPRHQSSTQRKQRTNPENKPKCKYGATCYKIKDPQHILEYSHHTHTHDKKPTSGIHKPPAYSSDITTKQQPRALPVTPCKYGETCRDIDPRHRRKYSHPTPKKRPWVPGGGGKSKRRHTRSSKRRRHTRRRR